MAPFRNTTSLMLLLIIVGYAESLRSVFFYAFNLENPRLGIFVSVAVMAYYYVMPFLKLTFTRFMARLALVLTIMLTPAANGYNMLFFLATIYYGLSLFLITGFILERKSAGEIFFLGGLFEVVAAITSDRGIVTYIIINLLFALALKIKLQILRVEGDLRLGPVEGSRTKKYIAALLILLSVSTMPWLYRENGSAFEKPRVLTLLAEKAAANTVKYGLWDAVQNYEKDGQVPQNDTPVMQVKSSAPAYWRGETADFYTGRGWRNSMLVRAAGNEDFSSPLQVGNTAVRTEQVFSFYPGTGSQIVYSGGASARIGGVMAQSPVIESGNIRLLTDEGGNFYFTEAAPGMTYRVVSYVPEINSRKPEDFSSDNSKSPGVNPKYLQLPEIPARVRALAESLTASASGPYAKAREIERFLSQNYPYDLKPTPLPEGQELTDFFLFDLKRGYCTYHSTAMAVMLRSLGIPARWVTGFTTGKYLPEKGVYEVKHSDSHAWVEVYIGGLGWVPFEPTAGFTVPSADSKEASPYQLNHTADFKSAGN